MRYNWMDDYLLNKRSVTKDFQPVWNWIRYHIGGKMFAAVCLDDQNQPYYINLKVDPTEGEFLISQYKDIIPGYYSDKKNWISIKADGTVLDELLKHVVHPSVEHDIVHLFPLDTAFFALEPQPSLQFPGIHWCFLPHGPQH